jgi:transcriptional regulator with XRE-family HTH domain
MTLEQWPKDLTSRVAGQMRAARKAAGLTTAELAQGCLDRGLDVPETTIKNLETGRRNSVALHDFLVLADVLGVPPVSLLFPLGSAATVEVLPGREVSSWDALAWFTGENAPEQPAPEGSAQYVLDIFRHHSDLAAAAMVSTGLAKERRRMASTALDKARRSALLERAAGYEEHAFEDCQELRAFRTRMVDQSLIPPALPEELAFVDEPEG